MTPDQIRDLADDEFYQLRRDMDADAERRARVAQFPEDLAALVQAASAAGVSADEVRGSVEDALVPEQQAEFEMDLAEGS